MRGIVAVTSLVVVLAMLLAMNAPRPRVGEPRQYWDVIDVLYPGEEAYQPTEISRSGVFTGTPGDVWQVTPAPGLDMWWRRQQCRWVTCIGQRRLAEPHRIE